MSHDLLLREKSGAAPPELYPDSIEIGGQKLPLSYCFSPGDAADGVTISLPLERLNTLQARLDGWLNDDFYRLRPEVFNDMRSQLDDLVADGFLQDLSPPRLEHYPRYLEAMPVLLPCDNCEFSELGSG